VIQTGPLKAGLVELGKGGFQDSRRVTSGALGLVLFTGINNTDRLVCCQVYDSRKAGTELLARARRVAAFFAPFTVADFLMVAPPPNMALWSIR
jgi:hypothetical protein